MQEHLWSMHIYWNILLQFSKTMALRSDMLKLVITWCDTFDNFLTDQYNHILIWDVDVQIWTLDNKILSMTSSNLPICTCLMINILAGLTSPHQNFLFRWVPLLLKITINMPMNSQYVCILYPLRSAVTYSFT